MRRHFPSSRFTKPSFSSSGTHGLSTLLAETTTHRLVWGLFIRFMPVSRAFGPGPSRARPVRGSCRVPGSLTHGSWSFEVERKALRLGPASPQSEPAESGHSSPPQGDSPYPRSWPPASKDTRSAAGSQ
jgi:hypothetical protein